MCSLKGKQKTSALSFGSSNTTESTETNQVKSVKINISKQNNQYFAISISGRSGGYKMIIFNCEKRKE